ncbi:MAG TPA: ABC transporter permease [Acidimicrobiales bacterium]|jgi:branched-chain amino acid transport system permease protein
MLQYIIAGLVLGGIYAIAASGLVITYQSAGVLNFSFGAIAYTVARFYYYLNTERTWPILPSALLSIAVLGPALGLLFYFGVFRYLRMSSTLVKVMATIGVSVALPPADTLVFGNQTILSAPGLAPQPVRVFRFLGVPVTMDQIIVYACVVVLLGAGFVILRYTDVGLQVRALVDSPAMTSLSGTNPGTMSTAVWVVSATLAGLAGVLVAPIIGLDAGDMATVMVTAFAAVIAAKLRSMPIAAVVGLGMGIASALVQYSLPAASTYTADLITGIPFIVIAVSLLIYIVRGGGVNEEEGIGGALDRAIRPQGQGAAQNVTAAGGAAANVLSWRPSAFAFVVICLVPLLLHGFWVGLLAQGIAYAIIFLSFTLVTGEGGMIWLCQATFAGGGGMGAALLAQDHHLPILLSVLIGGIIAVPFGVVIGLLTIRMGDLYVALVTLTFGLLVDDLVFTRQIFNNNGLGVNVNPPNFTGTGRALTYLGIVVFAIVAVIIVNLRRSTTGLGMSAVRFSSAGSRTIGINVLQMKLLVAAIAAFVAGIGGGLLAITLGVALPSNYSTLGGEVWLAVLVLQGIRSNAAALLAGLSQTLFAGIALVYLPKAFGNVVPILFGLGAVAIVKFPEGTLTIQARQVQAMFAKLREMRPATYQVMRVGGAAYLVLFVVLIITVRDLWWLWLLISFVLQNAVVGYVGVVTRGKTSVADPRLLSPDGVTSGVEREPVHGLSR